MDICVSNTVAALTEGEAEKTWWPFQAQPLESLIPPKHIHARKQSTVIAMVI